MVLPFIVKSDVRSLDFRPASRVMFWIFLVDAVILGWLGAKPASYPFVLVGQVATFLYFLLLLIVFPVLAQLEGAVWKDHFSNM